MQLTDIDRGRVTLELDPGDCLALDQACRAQIRNDATPDYEHTTALCVALEALGLAAFAMEDPQPAMGRALLWSVWGPREGREVGSSHHTGLDGEPMPEPTAVEEAAETAPACAEEAA
jgi:hypothetical protein